MQGCTQFCTSLLLDATIALRKLTRADFTVEIAWLDFYEVASKQGDPTCLWQAASCS